MFSNIAQIVTMDFCNFCMKMCYRELSKTAQSGHTGPQFRLSALTGSMQTWKAFSLSLSLSYFPSKFIFPFSNILFLQQRTPTSRLLILSKIEISDHNLRAALQHSITKMKLIDKINTF